MTELIRVDYEALTNVANQFQNEAEAITRTLQLIRRTMTPLQNGGWLGQGSAAFFSEMEGEVIPAVGRLADALTQANDVSRKIADVMQAAEEEAGSPFRASEIGGDGAFGSQASVKTIGIPAASPGGVNSNDYGIPSNWLDGVAGAMGVGSGSNNWGIPEDWLAGVTTDGNAVGGTATGAEGLGGGAAAGGSAGSAAGSGGAAGSPSEAQPTPMGGSGGGQTTPPTTINSPYGQQTVRAGSQTLFAGKQVTADAQAGRLSYQSLNVGTAAATAVNSVPVSSGGGGNAAPSSAGSGGSGASIGAAAAALLPLLGVMGKTAKDLLSDD